MSKHHRKKGNAIGRQKIVDGFKTPQARYDANNSLQMSLKINRNTESDIIEWLEKQPNKQGAIKQALRFYLSHKDKPLDGAPTAAIIDYLKNW